VGNAAGEWRWTLKDHRHGPRRYGRYPAAGRAFEPGECAHQRTLARTVGAEDHERFSRMQIERIGG
jgi:hypothetical protein